MRREGKVSIWTANFKNQEGFQNYIKEIYDEEGDSTSLFMTEFEIDYIDNQFQEAVFLGEVIHVGLLKSASYSESYLRNLEDIDFKDHNSIIIVYDFEYSGKIRETQMVNFVGAFDYDKL